jgi:hypothetical protein
MKRQAKTVSRQWLVLACALFFQAVIAAQELGAQAVGKNTQDVFPVLKGPYVGQKWSGPGAELFAPYIVSTGLFESYIAFTPDGRACYFNVELPPDLSVIVELKQEKGAWTAPEVASFSQGRGDANPAIATDGKHFYFTSMRSLDGGPTPSRRSNPWVMERVGNGWGPRSR